MQIVKYLFKNFFSDPRITDEKLRKFTSDHILRLEKNNASGAFSLLLTDTRAAFEEYFAGPKEEARGLQPEDGLEELMWQFKVHVTENEPQIRQIFKKGSVAYSNFFPRGLAEYTRAGKETIGLLMARFATVAAAHRQELGEPITTFYTTVSSKFKEATKTNTASTVTVKQTQTYRRACLEQQLCRNLHYIAYYHAGDAERCYALIDQNLLRLRFNDEPEIFSGVIFFGATINVISMGITHDTVFRVRNTGEVPLRCCLAENADTDNPDHCFQITPNQEMVVPASQLGDPAVYRFFNITNATKGVGRYEVLMQD